MFPLTLPSATAVLHYTLKTQNASILRTFIAISAQNICREDSGLKIYRGAQQQCARSFAKFAPSTAAVAEQVCILVIKFFPEAAHITYILILPHKTTNEITRHNIRDLATPQAENGSVMLARFSNTYNANVLRFYHTC